MPILLDLAGKIKKFVLDTIFPEECLGCGREGEPLCNNCRNTIKIDKHSLRGENLDRIFTFYSYDNDLLKKIIHCFKYKFVEDLAVPLGGMLGDRFCAESHNLEKSHILIPVPIHKSRLLERGFNQSALLAKVLSGRTGFKAEEGVLERTKKTSPQVELEENERRSNVKDAFCCKDILKVRDKKIILVDDVMTTGATMEECARILKSSGAKEVWGVALAKG